MSFNINEFKANGLKLGGARPNQFECSIFFPFQATAASRLKFVARSASIPPSILGEVPVSYFGRPVKFAGDRSFPDWEITIMNDEDYALRVLFENWSNRINTLVSNRMDVSTWPVGYKVDGEVKHYGKDGRVIRKYIFEGLWPKVVDTMNLDWNSTNQIQEFNVTLAYDLWVPEDVAGSPIDGAYSPILPDDGVGS